MWALLQYTFIDSSGDAMQNSIVFTHHAIERKTEREDWLVRTSKYQETRKRKDDLSSLMTRKGNWFCRYDDEEKLLKFYCIINNLEVYCGIFVEEEDIILITTYYSYTPKMKRRLFPRGMENFDSIDISIFNPKEYLIEYNQFSSRLK